MHTTLKRCISFLLVFALTFCLFPAAYAAEIAEQSTPSSDGTGSAPPEETIASTVPVEETEPSAAPSESTVASQPTAPSVTEDDELSDTVTEENSLPTNDSTPFAIGSTQKNIMLFDYADNGNYTTVLNYQVSCSYKPNGTGSTKTAYIKNLGWHFARYGGVPYPDDPLYCIEPYRTYGASTSGNSVDRDVTMDGTGSTTGSNAWYSLPAARREAIGLILLYSNQMWDHSISVQTTSKANNPNVPLRIATQFLIYEIVCGLRDPVTFQSNSTNECGTKGDIFYNAGESSVPYFAPNYNTLVSNIQAAKKIPSFTSASSGSAPTITLTGEETSVNDSNGVLSKFSFTDGNGAEFYKSGNTLYITQTGNVSESTVFRATRYLPSATNSTYNIWYMQGSSYQTTISLASASSGSLNAYFKLKGAPLTGNISLTKTTEDGKNLSGWQFGIYSNAACTALVSGPHTTNASGKISVSGLNAGTYYVKELGHSDSAINALYICASTNPQKVTVSGGQTATVTFKNNLASGALELIKTTNTGENLGGWKINLYTDADCTNLVDGSPFTTGQDGKVLVADLKPGTYYAKEIASTDPYWKCDSEIKSVKLTAGQTAAMTFSNTHYGCIKIQKTTNTGKNLDGWVFRVLDMNSDVIGEFTTDKDGVILLENLLPGRYIVQELPIDDPYWSTEFGWHDVVVEAGDVVTDTWLNKEQGLTWFHKQTNTGDNLEGWEITIYSDEACTQKISTLTTNQEGKIGYYLDPGIYYAKETGDTLNRFGSEYWLIDAEAKKFEVKPHEDTAVFFTNNYFGSLKIIKTMEDGSTPNGWQFQITDADGKEISGSPFTTGEDGKILTGAIAPGVYAVKELIPEDSAYYCKSENPQSVTVVQGETAEVSFTNALRPGKISLEKVDLQGKPLAGATFLLEYSEDGNLWWPIKYSESEKPVSGGCSNPNVVDGCLTSGEDGILEWDNLLPGLYYRIKEVKAPEGFNLLKKLAYNDQLTTDDLHITIRVINTRTFNLPETGSNGLLLMPVLGMFLMGIGFAVIHTRKRRV